MDDENENERIGKYFISIDTFENMLYNFQERYSDLKKHFMVFYDEGGAIGRRYRRQDEVGTPYCITVDSQTLEDQTVTVRERDSMGQERVSIDKIKMYLDEKLKFPVL